MGHNVLTHRCLTANLLAYVRFQNVFRLIEFEV